MASSAISKPATAADHVAFAACGVGAGRLLRVGLVADVERRPTVARIDHCPGCGNPHGIVTLLWRRTEARDDGKSTDLLVDAEGRQAPDAGSATG